MNPVVSEVQYRTRIIFAVLFVLFALMLIKLTFKVNICCFWGKKYGPTTAFLALTDPQLPLTCETCKHERSRIYSRSCKAQYCRENFDWKFWVGINIV